VANCEVVKYDIAALKNCLRGHSGCSQSILDAKVQTTVFEEYFKHLRAQTMVVELDYVDRDYLEDFAGYYVKCFHEYRRKCTRLHFFTEQFDQAEFEALLRGDASRVTAEMLQESYLGFIVVKPLPQTIIGRTCLRTYGDDARRKYPITREYDANLVGFPLRVKESLAFQEQDSVVAACATSALWSAFHGTGKLFQHRIPTPVEITRSATDDEPSESRNIPNRGLSPSQMAHAIRDVGLEPLLVNARDPAILRNTVYAYVRGRVPLILGIILFDDWSPGTPLPPAPAGPWRWLDQHAVAVTGFSLGKPTPVPEASSGFMLESSRIDELYVHDDGVGPFARMLMDEKPGDFLFEDGSQMSTWSMHTSWRLTHAKTLGMRAVPLILMAPLYHKIRIPYAMAEGIVRAFDELVSTLGSKVSATNRMTWDIRLAVGSDVKTAVASGRALLGPARETFLLTPLPRFVWHASASLGGDRVVDLLFDATDIQQGNLVRAVLEYDAAIAAAIRANAAAMLAKAPVQRHPVRHVFEWFSAAAA
jgi:hypothetical protein